jgi:L-methionine (R)-S-oxide reductase
VSIESGASFDTADKAGRYAQLHGMLRSVCDGENDLIANLANTAALIKECLPLASWAGFYIQREQELVLGPFQGKVACVRITLDRGVCGAAASSKRTLLVPDVEAFPGHIACDAGSRSEIVVPVIVQDKVVAVIDVDSYQLAAFDAIDQRELEMVAAWCGTLRWS